MQRRPLFNEHAVAIEIETSIIVNTTSSFADLFIHAIEVIQLIIFLAIQSLYSFSFLESECLKNHVFSHFQQKSGIFLIFLSYDERAEYLWDKIITLFNVPQVDETLLERELFFIRSLKCWQKTLAAREKRRQKRQVLFVVARHKVACARVEKDDKIEASERASVH
jgi:hypothetical protein